MTLPCSGQWLGFAQGLIAGYSGQVGFSEKLESMVTLSVMEALEELLRRSGEKACQVTLDLDYKGHAVVIDMEYDAGVPLHPHETGDWEVPDDLDSLGDQDMDSLWLHLIKKRMDRVCFMIQGSRRILRMAKYRRDEGKEKQAWIMGVVPRLRPDLILHPENPETESSGVLLQKPGSGVLRLGPSEAFLIRHMDGENSFHDLYMAHVDAVGLVSPAALAGLYEQLEKMGMLARNEENQGRMKRFLNACINPDFVIPGSDAVVTRVHGLLKPLYSKAGVVLLLAMGLSGLIPAIGDFHELAAQVAGLEMAFASSPWLFAPLYGMLLVHAACHELGHGTACKHFGGKVPRMGVMFYLASFMFYCDTTASLNFPGKRERLLVSLAGPLVSFAILGAGLWGLGLSLDTGAAPLLTAFCLVSAVGLVMNFNPFIKMDAYYMLSDITGIPNLRQRSFDFIWSELRQAKGKKRQRSQSPDSNQRRIFWIYGLGGVLVTGLFLVFPLLRLIFFLHGESASGGALVLILALIILVCLRLGRLAFERLHALRNQAFKIQ